MHLRGVSPSAGAASNNNNNNSSSASVLLRNNNQNRLLSYYNQHHNIPNNNNKQQRAAWSLLSSTKLIIMLLVGAWLVFLLSNSSSSSSRSNSSNSRGSSATTRDAALSSFRMLKNKKNKNHHDHDEFNSNEFLTLEEKEDAAKELCLVVRNPTEKEQCIKVVMSIDDRDVAEDYVRLRKKVDAIHNSQNKEQHLPQQHQHATHTIPQHDAEDICSHIPEMHKQRCIHDVMAMDDPGVAKHYVHLLEVEEKEQEQELEEEEIPEEEEEAQDDQAGTITSREATILCSRAVEKSACIHDVIAMQDRDMVDAYEQHPAQHHHHQIEYKDATSACVPIVIEEDKNQCIQDVMAMNDKEVAMHYVKLLRDKEDQDIDDSISFFEMHAKEAELACAAITNQSYKAECMNDVMATNDKKVALKFVKMLQQQEQQQEQEQQNNNGQPMQKENETDEEENETDNLITPKEAAIVCLRAKEKHECIHDVLAMQDTDMADAYEHHPDPKTVLEKNNSNNKNNNNKAAASLPDHHHKISQKEAEEACVPINDPSDKVTCIKDIMAINDKDIALHYIHLLEDVEKAHETLAEMTAEEAQDMCRPLQFLLQQANKNKKKTKSQQQEDINNCIKEVLSMNNRHVAEHYVNLLIREEEKESNNANGDNGASSSGISQIEAEQICNHISFSNNNSGQQQQQKQEYKKETCIQDVMAMNGKEAAEHYIHLLQQKQKHTTGNTQSAPQNNIERPKAEELCTSLGAVPRKQSCIDDVMTMNDPKIAKSYVQLLKKQQQQQLIEQEGQVLSK